MKIELTKIKVSDLFDGFVDNNEEGVRGLKIKPYKTIITNDR